MRATIKEFTAVITAAVCAAIMASCTAGGADQASNHAVTVQPTETVIETYTAAVTEIVTDKQGEAKVQTVTDQRGETVVQIESRVRPRKETVKKAENEAANKYTNIPSVRTTAIKSSTAKATKATQKGTTKPTQKATSTPTAKPTQKTTAKATQKTTKYAANKVTPYLTKDDVLWAQKKANEYISTLKSVTYDPEAKSYFYESGIWDGYRTKEALLEDWKEAINDVYTELIEGNWTNLGMHLHVDFYSDPDGEFNQIAEYTVRFW
ncbi:MAG: hypothetical protein ACI4IV_06095 [Acutalibacteraceae bacterium]